MKLHSCPKQANCGANDVIEATLDGVAIKQEQGTSIPKYTTGQICHYEVRFPSTSAKKGDVIYLNIITLSNVKASIYIAENLTQEVLDVCDNNVQAGDFLVANYPKRFFITFESTSSASTAFYYVNAIYA